VDNLSTFGLLRVDNNPYFYVENLSFVDKFCQKTGFFARFYTLSTEYYAQNRLYPHFLVVCIFMQVFCVFMRLIIQKRKNKRRRARRRRRYLWKTYDFRLFCFWLCRRKRLISDLSRFDEKNTRKTSVL
jgi:hypothetical protein